MSVFTSNHQKLQSIQGHTCHGRTNPGKIIGPLLRADYEVILPHPSSIWVHIYEVIIFIISVILFFVRMFVFTSDHQTFVVCSRSDMSWAYQSWQSDRPSAPSWLWSYPTTSVEHLGAYLRSHNLYSLCNPVFVFECLFSSPTIILLQSIQGQACQRRTNN